MCIQWKRMEYTEQHVEKVNSSGVNPGFHMIGYGFDYQATFGYQYSTGSATV